MACIAFLFLAAVVGSGFSSPPCIKECPQDCGQKELGNGCLECVCEGTFFPVPPPPPRRPGSPNDKFCPRECPQDCGQTVQENGCLKCECGANPFFKPTPKPPRNTRETDTDICFRDCPQDCGCLVKNGKAECDCTAGPNHPLIKPPVPPPPRPQRGRRESVPDKPNDAVLCRQKCQPDCGCTITEAGEAQCHCSAENNPLIQKIPPTPPRPVLPNVTPATAEDDGTLCRRKCPADCGCLVNNGEATCHCTAENHPLIKRPIPTPFPPPRTPPVLHRRDAASDAEICQQECPADCGCVLNENRQANCECSENPFGRPPPPPPQIQCSPPKCDDPCVITYDSTKGPCPFCKCS